MKLLRDRTKTSDFDCYAVYAAPDGSDIDGQRRRHEPIEGLVYDRYGAQINLRDWWIRLLSSIDIIRDDE